MFWLQFPVRSLTSWSTKLSLLWLILATLLITHPWWNWCQHPGPVTVSGQGIVLLSYQGAVLTSNDQTEFSIKYQRQVLSISNLSDISHDTFWQMKDYYWPVLTSTDHWDCRTRALMTEVGQGPVSLTREVPGFVLNRIQYSVLNECWRLIRDGVVTPQVSN